MSDFLNGSSLFRKRRRVTDYAPSLSTQHSDRTLTEDTISEDASEQSSRPTTAIRSDGQQDTQFSPSKRSHRRDSSLSSFSELRSSLRRRSTSLRSKGRDASNLWDKLAQSNNNANRSPPTNARPQLNISTLSSQPSTDSLALRSIQSREPASAIDSKPSRPTYFQQAFSAGAQRRDDLNLRPATSLGAPYSSSTRNASYTQLQHTLNPRTASKKVSETSKKRISLLNYLRMIYATQTHWFNTYRFSTDQIYTLPSMQGSRLARRTQSLFLLGLSLPFALDPNCGSLPEYLRALSHLLSEYESYNILHPADGAQHSVYRAKIPNMFKRGVSGAAKARRGSSADGLLASPQSAEDARMAGNGGMGSAGLPGGATWASFPNMAQEADLMPGEEYSFLLTPGLPFECDYAETFGTVCDVLCDVYQHLDVEIGKIAEKEGNSSGAERDTGPSLSAIVEMFGKVDAKIKKQVLVGLVREFEDASRQGIKTEIAGVGKLVLGGLV